MAWYEYAVGLILSVKNTIGLEIAFAAAIHLRQTISFRSLRCVLDLLTGLLCRQS